MHLFTSKKTRINTQWFILWGIVLGRYVEVLFLALFLAYVYRAKGWKANNGIFIFFLLLGIHAVISNFMNGYSNQKSMQQLLLLFICIWGYFQFFSFYVHSVLEIWDKYMKLVYWISLIGIVQFIICLITGIDIFPTTFVPSSRIMRLHSFLFEPGTFATFISPALIYTLFHTSYWREFKARVIVIWIAEILTFTTIGYFIIALGLFFRFYVYFRKWRIILLPLVATFLVMASSNPENSKFVGYHDDLLAAIRMKFFQSISAFNDFNPENFELLNASSYATMSNLWIANNAPNRILGTGLGTHELNYERGYQSDYSLYGLNKSDAYSLFIRIYSEFGFIGIIIAILLLKRFLCKESDISISILFFFIASAVRGGHYTMYGVIFFVYMYYNIFITQKLLGKENKSK